MASNYGLNFGFRRSDESMAIREGRMKVPATGTFKQGQCVAIDPANPGFLKTAAAGEDAVSGYTGLLVQEEAWDRSIYGAQSVDSYGLDAILNNRLATIWSGPGTKVWFKNTTGGTRADGRVIPAGGLVDFTTPPAIGDHLGWNGTKWAVVAAGPDAFMRVTLSNGVDYCEAVLLH